MSDNLKYYFVKIKEDYYESDEMILLESMQDGYIYSNILMKLHLRSLRNGGKLMLNDKIPYNDHMLASVTRHSIGNVRQALEIFQNLGLVEILKNGAIFMTDIQNLIGRSSTEADRKREYRAKIEAEKKSLKSPKKGAYKDTKGQMSDKRPPEIRDIEYREQKDNSYVYQFAENRTRRDMQKTKEISKLESLAEQKKEIEI
jgi:predicted phage replisome organizer